MTRSTAERARKDGSSALGLANSKRYLSEIVVSQAIAESVVAHRGRQFYRSYTFSQRLAFSIGSTLDDFLEWGELNRSLPRNLMSSSTSERRDNSPVPYPTRSTTQGPIVVCSEDKV